MCSRPCMRMQTSGRFQKPSSQFRKPSTQFHPLLSYVAETEETTRSVVVNALLWTSENEDEALLADPELPYQEQLAVRLRLGFKRAAKAEGLLSLPES